MIGWFKGGRRARRRPFVARVWVAGGHRRVDADEARFLEYVLGDDYDTVYFDGAQAEIRGTTRDAAALTRRLKDAGYRATVTYR